MLGPGQENAVLTMLDVEVCELKGASIDRDSIVAEYACPEVVEVVWVHPSVSDSTHRTERFALEGDAPPALIDAALQRTREHGERVQWAFARDPKKDPPRWTRYLTWALMAALLVVALLELKRQPPQLDRLDLALLGVVGAAWLLVPDWAPIHDHLTFTARSDCALMGCDRDRPGWLPPAYHAYRVWLHLVPYTSRGLSALSWFLSLCSLAAMLAWLREVNRDSALPRLALLCCGLHPLVMRAAVAHSFWPLALPLLWLGALMAARQRPFAWLAACLAWSLAATTSVAMIGPVIVFVVVALRRSTLKRSLLVVPLAAFIALHALPFVMDIHTSTEGFESVAARFGWRHFIDHTLVDPRTSPLGFTILLLVGVWVGRRSVSIPLTLAILTMLPFVGEPLRLGFPVAVLHGFPLVCVAAPIAAFAWAQTPTKFRALPPALLVLTAPFAVEAFVQPTPIAREQAAIEGVLSALPEHDVLVIAPEILEPRPGHDWSGDPIEVQFPVGFYRNAGHTDSEIVFLDHFLEHPRFDRTLVYVGTALRSFQASEVDHHVVRDPRRPLLQRLEELAELEPVQTFELTTEAHPWIITRVTADTRPKVELGFYRPRVNPGDR